MKPAADFTDEERSVIRHRRRYDDAATLAAVFGTSSHVIAAICRDHQPTPYPIPSQAGRTATAANDLGEASLRRPGSVTIDEQSEPGSWQRAFDRGCLEGRVSDHPHGKAQ